MTSFSIQGGKPISGTFTPAGNKNAALPMLAACLLTPEPVVLHNVPVIEDVAVMIRLLASLGVEVERSGSTVKLTAREVSGARPARALCRRVRASMLLAGPLAARTGKAELYPPGGDVIGRRRIDTHVVGLEALGYRFKAGTTYRFSRSGPAKGASMLLDEASVTATENILMAATLAEGESVIYNAACEPHVQDLGNLLIRMGADIDGLGTNRIVVRGVKRLHGAEAEVGPDLVEVGSFMGAALVTGGRLKVRGVSGMMEMEVLRRAWSKLGVSWATRGRDVLVDGTKPLKVADDLGAAIPKIEDGVWPSFPSDLMSVSIVLATQAQGSLLFFEKLFESRMYFVDRLIEMGARIVQCDPHRVVVNGPSRLGGIHMSSPDIRAGMSMVIAALCARGKSVIENAEMIDRGYERVDERLRALGAVIERNEG